MPGSSDLTFAIKAINEASKVLADVKRDVEGVDTAADKASGSGGKLAGALGNIATSAAGFAIGAGITKLPGFLFSAAEGAAADEAATARLNKTLENLGTSTGASAEQVAAWGASVDDAIDSGAKLAFTDDDVRDSFQFLVGATGDVDEALKRQKAAMDLARGANIPLATATKMLGKLNEENVEVFKKLGITLGDSATEADALAAVQAKFGGQADEYAKSTAGQFEVAKIRMAEAQETIGAALIPVMTTLAAVLSEILIPALETFANNVGPVASAVFGGIGAAIEALEPFLLPIVAAIGAVAAVILGAMVPAALAWAAAELAKAAALWTAAAAFVAANAPLILAAVLIAAVVAAIVLLIQHWGTVVEKFPILGTIVDGVKTALGGFATWITDTFVPIVAGIATAVTDGVGAAISWVTANWGAIEGLLSGPVEAAKVIISTIIGNIQTLFSGMFTVIGGLLDVFIGLFTGDWGRLASGINTIVTGIKTTVVGIFTDTFTAIGELGGMAWTAAEKLGSNIVDGLVDGLGKIVGKAMDIGASIVGALKGAINSSLRWLHDNVRIEVGGFDPPGPGSIPGFTWAFPLIQLAKGVRNFTGGMALVGEEGPELVMLPPGADVYPASRTRDVIRDLSGHGPNMSLAAGAAGTVGGVGGQTIQIVINAIDGASVERAAPMIWDALQRHSRGMLA